VANALLLRPLPYADAERLVILWNRSPGLNITETGFHGAISRYQNGHHGFEQVAIAIGGNYNITGEGEPERVGVIRVSANLLPMLGVVPAYGQCWRRRKICRDGLQLRCSRKDVGPPVRARPADDRQVHHDQRTAV